jgi:hypothetical protein
MTKSKLHSIAILLTATCIIGAALSAEAQQTQTPAPAPSAGGPPGAPPPGSAPGGQAGPTAPQGAPWPVVMVTSVEVLRSERSGGMDIVRARGLVTSTAWGSPHLVAITHGKPIDGVLDVLFLATAPQVPAAAGPFMPVEAFLPIGHGHPYKAVRVRSGTNVITIKSLPGFSEAPGPKNDCSKCVGKYFLARGATAPAGVVAADIVRQEDLPWDLRVILPTQGIAGYSVDPNRLTLVLSEDGRIADAAWD